MILGFMLSLSLITASLNMKRSLQEISKTILVSIVSGIFFPLLTAYTAVQYLCHKDKPTKAKYRARLMVLKQYELLFEAFPQAITSWFVLYSVDLGDGILFPGDETIISLLISTVSLMNVVESWHSFRGMDAGIKGLTWPERLRKLKNLFLPAQKVLTYSLVFHYLHQYAFLLPTLTIMLVTIVIKKSSEESKLLAIIEAFHSIITSTTSMTYDYIARVKLNTTTIFLQFLFTGITIWFSCEKRLRYVIIPGLHNNITIQAIEAPDKVYPRIYKATENLRYCRNICNEIPVECEEYLNILTRESSAEAVRFILWSIFLVYILCVNYSFQFGLLNVELYPSKSKGDRYKENETDLENIRKHLNSIKGTADETIHAWRTDLELTIQTFLDSPIEMKNTDERLADILGIILKNRENEQKRLLEAAEYSYQIMQKQQRNWGRCSRCFFRGPYRTKRSEMMQLSYA